MCFWFYFRHVCFKSVNGLVEFLESPYYHYRGGGGGGVGVVSDVN